MDKIRYEVTIEWDSAEKLYVGTIPVLSIGSYSATRQEAIGKIEEAAEVTIEGLRETGQRVPQCS